MVLPDVSAHLAMFIFKMMLSYSNEHVELVASRESIQAWNSVFASELISYLFVVVVMFKK
jgi:hypothetical protein